MFFISKRKLDSYITSRVQGILGSRLPLQQSEEKTVGITIDCATFSNKNKIRELIEVVEPTLVGGIVTLRKNYTDTLVVESNMMVSLKQSYVVNDTSVWLHRLCRGNEDLLATANPVPFQAALLDKLLPLTLRPGEVLRFVLEWKD